MQSNFQDIAEFHGKFGLEGSKTPKLLDPATMVFRLNFLTEELNEIHKGHAEQDIAQIADGLIDLVYVAMGTAHMMGLPWQALWDEVQSANMRKVRTTDPSQSKRGSSLDVVKPEGWVGPNIEKVLEEAGYNPDKEVDCDK